MKVKKREVYIAEDGSEFLTEQDAINHEKEVAAQQRRIEKLQIYSVVHGFDGTEGRGYYNQTEIVTDQSFMTVLEYCFSRFGPVFSGWYGDGYYEAWTLHGPKTPPEKGFHKIVSKRLGSLSERKKDRVFLSKTPLEIDNLPEPIFPWPRQAKETQ